MSGSASAVPPDRTYTDLKPEMVAFLQQSAPIEALSRRLIASLVTTIQPNGLSTVAIRYSAASAEAAPVPPLAARAAPASAGAMSFTSGGTPLAEAEFTRSLTDLGGLDRNLLWALLHQEGGNPPVGFLPDRRPQILYERHIFARLTNNRFTSSHPDISGPRYVSYGTYPQQYARLEAAMALDKSAALQACSWGIGQVLGENAIDLDFPDVETMVQKMIESEGQQLTIAATFLIKKGCLAALTGKDWMTFALCYNGGGSGSAYATSLETYYTACQSKPPPDFKVRTAQLYLNYLGHGLQADGENGKATQTAVMKFQQLMAIAPADGVLSDSTFQAIVTAASQSPAGQ